MVIFFDLDDTLIDSQGAVASALREMHLNVCPDRSIDLLTSRWRDAHDRHYPRYLEGEISYEHLRRLRVRDAMDLSLGDDRADALFDKYMAAYEANWALFDDVLPCLDALNEFDLGVITNGPSYEQRRKLIRLGIDTRFCTILVSEECEAAKPSPHIFLRACDMAAVAPADAVYIGDRYETDYLGSKAVGMRALWLYRRSKVRDGEHVVTSLSQVPEVLASS
jgi:putative hydrolase of the HAD superfamily